MEFERALGLVRLIIDSGVSRDDAINNPVIPEAYKQQLYDVLAREENIVLEPPRILVAEAERGEWLRQLDRSDWFYWPALRQFLLAEKDMGAPAVRSLDEITDRILEQLAPLSSEKFDIRGLVLGYVQSGKTANYTGLISKAADVGYRLVIVLSGIDNGLRRQTQVRLNRELVGYADNRAGGVRLPPMGKRWHQFTSEELDGDFRPGFANYAALQGTEPVLLVVKKNGAVLRRLHSWLDAAPEDIRNSLPVLIIDDEADLSSVDTRGSYLREEDALPEDYEAPSVINGLIRGLLNKFQRRAYVAYTATPFANVLIPHDVYDPRMQNDLYPKDFIIDLPKPPGYFGAEELFGRFDRTIGEDIGGLDVVRDIPDADLERLDRGVLPTSLESAMLDFVLAGAARAKRGDGNAPATMLIHVSQLIIDQLGVAETVNQKFSEIKDDWRYQRRKGLLNLMNQRWEERFRPAVRSYSLNLDVAFKEIEPFIGPFIESVQVRVINSARGDVLDYEREPNLKAIAIGGNKLSRGLTLEGLLVSYFVRQSVMYDTLMQMGRWFGFREGYEDLTRIYMPSELGGWFSDLALVEYELRQDIQVYEAQGLTPLELGTRILQHPGRLVTSRAKQRFATRITVEQSYAAKVEQSFRFPFRRPDELARLLQQNVVSTRSFLRNLGNPSEWTDKGPLWRNIGAEAIIEFLGSYVVDSEVRNLSLPLICSYISRQRELGELTNWTVAVMGRESLDGRLGQIDLNIVDPIRPIFSVERNRLRGDENSLGVITSPNDEAIGLSAEEIERVRTESDSKKIGANPAARQVRAPSEGLLLIYPISKYSGSELAESGSRQPLYENPEDHQACDIIGIAISFPASKQAQSIRGEYVVGSVGWRPV